MSQSDSFIQTMEKGDMDECAKVLQEFNKEHEKAQEISFLTMDEKKALWNAIFNRLENRNANTEITADLLSCLRILCREKQTLELVMTSERVNCLLQCSGLNSDVGPTHAEHLSGMKVIFNMLFQSETMQTMFVESGLLKFLIQHVNPNKKDIPQENLYFLLRIFFIITALSKSSGALVRNDLNGIAVLVHFMDRVGVIELYDNMTVDLLSEACKIMYNIIHDIFPKSTEPKAEMFDSKDFTLLCEICRLARRHLLCITSSLEKKLELSCHSIHLLCALPPECYVEILCEDFGEVHEPIFDESYTDMAVIEAIVQIADAKLDATDKAPATPILLALSRMATANRKIRKYLKKRILPPLTKTDLMERPEVGTSLRNKLCAVIHTPAGNLTEVAANLIFVLCKESVSKMVKYTGYGNAAGLLANRGLMLGGKGDGNYSDTSDESETEDYLEIKDEINYVEGRIKAEEPSVEMTEEQKEFEAMKLVEAIDKLSASKLIQPCRIGEDGKPQPIEHVLELQDALDNPMKNARTTSDSDSD